jgi:hypothetical protein
MTIRIRSGLFTEGQLESIKKINEQNLIIQKRLRNISEDSDIDGCNVDEFKEFIELLDNRLIEDDINNEVI